MDFSYPAEVEQFRGELRDWLEENLTDELVAARRPTGRDDAAFDAIRLDYGDLQGYLNEGLGLGATERAILQARYLEA